MKTALIAIVGERDLAKKAHQGIEASLALYRREGDGRPDHKWVGTSAITADSGEEIFSDATGIWCAPGSPYGNTLGALAAIKHARTTRRAFLGTCGGFQHALMEFAQTVLLRPADHHEMTPAATDPLIVKLSCSLVGAQGRVVVTEPGRFADILGGGESVEEFNCNYGVNDYLVEIFLGSDLRFVAHDEAGQARAFWLEGHPFFAGTLFQPERRALAGSLHPVVRAFFAAAEAAG